MKKRQTIELTSDEAIILQQIEEAGEEDVRGLVYSLRMTHQQVVAILERLKHKGLIRIHARYGDWWVRVSVHGKRTLAMLWPEILKTC